ncbi:MAG: hypothetical protein Q8Q01_02975 [archaeon]|nr:hypothetical protein [archaeon]
MALSIEQVILAVIIGTLLAIVYSLKTLIVIERRIASVEGNIQRMASKVLQEETKIEKMISKKSRKSSRPSKRRR